MLSHSQHALFFFSQDALSYSQNPLSCGQNSLSYSQNSISCRAVPNHKFWDLKSNPWRKAPNQMVLLTNCMQIKSNPFFVPIQVKYLLSDLQIIIKSFYCTWACTVIDNKYQWTREIVNNAAYVLKISGSSKMHDLFVIFFGVQVIWYILLNVASSSMVKSI